MFNPIKKIQKWNIDRQQKKLNEEYELNGYSDDIFEKQVKLNEKKYKLNIPDEDYIQ